VPERKKIGDWRNKMPFLENCNEYSIIVMYAMAEIFTNILWFVDKRA
jgi:hypothetical protein